MSTPYISSLMEVEPSWIDFNGHMNMAFYSQIFDRAAEEFCRDIGLGAAYAESRRLTTYTGEVKIRYLHELHLGQQMRVHSSILDRDEKRFHVWQEIHAEDGFLAATAETIGLHIDMSGPKVVPFPADIATALDAFIAKHGRAELPEGAGQPIGIKRR